LNQARADARCCVAQLHQPLTNYGRCRFRPIDVVLAQAVNRKLVQMIVCADQRLLRLEGRCIAGSIDIGGTTNITINVLAGEGSFIDWINKLLNFGSLTVCKVGELADPFARTACGHLPNSLLTRCGCTT